MSIAALLLVILLAFATASAQSSCPSPTRPEGKQDVATFSTNVNLVMVPVVVRDSTGHIVDGLTEENFQVFDNKKLQSITRFSVERGSASKENLPLPTALAAPTPRPGETLKPGFDNNSRRAESYIAYVFDDRDIYFNHMAALRNAALRHFREVPITDRAAIYTFSGRTTLDFTRDKAKLEDTVTNLRVQMTRSHGGNEECPDVSYYLADLIVNAKDSRALDAVARQTAECIPGVVDPWFVALSAARKEIFVGAQDTRIALDVLKTIIRRLAELPGQRTIVLASPGFFPRTPDERAALESVLDLAAKNDVSISTLDVRGVYTTHHSDASNGLRPPPRPNPRLFGGPPPVASQGRDTVQPNDVEGQYYEQSAIASGDVLGDLAAGTGGINVHGNNDLTAALNRLASPPEVRYLIGFSPSELTPDGSFHSLRVSVGNKRRVSIQARRGYYAANPAEIDSWQQMHDAVFSRDEINEIPMDVGAQLSKAGSADARLTALAKIHAECLRYQMSEGRSRDSLTMVWALFNDEGDYVNGTTTTVNLALSDASVARADNAGINVQSSYVVKPGAYLVRVVIQETGGAVMSAHNLTVIVR